MKKQNKNIFAYVQGPTHNRYQCISDLSGKYGSKSSGNLRGGYRYHGKKEEETQLGSSGIYQEIVGQMEPDYYEYLNKLIDKSKKQENKQRRNAQNQKNDQSHEKVFPAQFEPTNQTTHFSPQNEEISSIFKSATKTPTHQRTKSYANILIQSTKPSHLDQTTSKFTGNKIQPEKMLLSAPTSPKIKKMEFALKKGTTQKEDRNFLGCIDDYINNLGRQPNNEKQTRLQQRRTISKSNMNSTITASAKRSSKQSIQNDQNFDQKQVKTLKYANYYLETEHNKMKKKYNKLKEKVKVMAESIEYLNNLLQEEQNERNRIQCFLQEIQGRILSIRPERKTIGRMQSPCHYQFSDTTEQSFSELDDKTKENDLTQMFFNKKLVMPKRLIKNRNSLPRSGNQFVPASQNKKKQVARSLTRQELTAILAQKQYDESEGSQQTDIIEL